MKKIISIITLISLVFLTSCGKEVEVKEEKKKDFVVNITEFNEFSTEAILNKT
jgi:PBP1b-binding outer membrane lipoprotein LpoB